VQYFTSEIPVRGYRRLSQSPDRLRPAPNGEKIHMKGIAALFIDSTILASPYSAHAWGGDGHRTVAAIAFKLLPPANAAALDRLW
jgi:hypothetical protein